MTRYLVVHLQRGSEVVNSKDEAAIIRKYLDRVKLGTIRVYTLHDAGVLVLEDEGEFVEVAQTWE